MHSLWHDHDLKIENNHAKEDYATFYHALLAPDYRTRGTDGQIYSIHPIGLPVMAAALFGLAGYKGVVWLLVVMAAATAALMWHWAGTLTGSDGAATVAWAAVCLGAPFLFNSFAVYPEIPAALCVMVAVGWRPGSTRPAPLEYMVRGLAISALPWLSTKYAPMAVALGLMLAWRVRRHSRVTWALASPFIVSLAAWVGFFYWIGDARHPPRRTGRTHRPRSPDWQSEDRGCCSIRSTAFCFTRLPLPSASSASRV